MFYLGIDGGKKGGFVLMDLNMRIVQKCIMPITPDKDFDIPEIVRILKSALSHSKALCVYLEQAHPRPISGKRACFMNGFGYGIIQGILQGMEIDYKLVAPSVWMKSVLGANRQLRIKGSVDWCRDNYPGEVWRPTARSTNAHDGMTDACCIAVYGCTKKGEE